MRESRERECGKCAACCVAPRLEELEKPAWTKCQHARIGRPAGACSIYKDRPASCQSFTCGWLSTPDMPEVFRPDRCGFMLVARPQEGTDTLMIEVWELTQEPFEGSRLEEWLENTGQAELYDWTLISQRRSSEPIES